MTQAPARSATPIGAWLAIVGGGLALLSLVLPWYTLDHAAFGEAFRGVVRQFNDAAAGVVDPADLAPIDNPAFAAAAADRAATKIAPTLVGFSDGIPWVVLRVAAILAAVLGGLRVIQGRASAVSERMLFAGAGIALAVRPLMDLVSTPASEFDGAIRTMAGLKVSEYLTPAPGLYLGLLAAALLVVAAGMMAERVDQPQEVAPTSQPTSNAATVTAASTPSTAPPGF